jgi:hypothetical protein
MTFQFEIVSAVKCQAFRFAMFHLRLLFCVSLVLKVISLDRIAVLTCFLFEFVKSARLKNLA